LLWVLAPAGTSPEEPGKEAQTRAVAPADLRIFEVTSHSITASWSPNGNPSRALYQADIWSAGSPPRSLVLLSTTACFERLSAATVYHVRVRASIGDGPPGEAASSSMATLPEGASAKRAPEGSALEPEPSIWVVPGDPHWVQVGAYVNSAHAQALASALNSSGHKALVADRKARGRLLHQVRIGPFANWGAAQDEADRLEADKTLDKLEKSLKK
jgi:cell division septation protein DedD